MGHKTWTISKQPQKVFYNFIKENLAQVLFWDRCTYFEKHLQMTASGLALVSHRSLKLYSCFNLKCISRVFLWILQIFSHNKSQWNCFCRLYFYIRIASIFPVAVYLFNVNNGGTRAMCEICLKLKIKTSERRHWRFVNFEQVHVGWVTSLRLTDMICLTSDLYFQFWKNGICSLAISELKKIHSLRSFFHYKILENQRISVIFSGEIKRENHFFFFFWQKQFKKLSHRCLTGFWIDF